MKTKSFLLCLALLLTGALTAQTFAPATATVTVSVEQLLNRAAINRNISLWLAPDSDYAAGYFRGKADAQEEIIALGLRNTP
ncbi:MAG: hypothetical protein NTV51_10610 [Verrucomicrobia bacterium]|nr:hypothetical protein [Verrucomicrobiota bacterium]